MKRKWDSNVETSTESYEYEVFLSFCGKDTRKTFTDFLYEDLKQSCILTFRDDNELRVGEEIGAELLKAIKNSKISIPIFSKNYGFSKWCLLELEQMVECYENRGQIIYPIFYDVDPSDVRNQKESYERAFSEHEKKFKAEDVKRWRHALRVVGELKGLELLKETNGHQGRLVKIVVEKVLLDLKRDYTSEPDVLVGINKHVENLKGLLKLDAGGVRIVGIHGMGGLGKTTIAKITYNRLCGSFDGHCFLDNVRESSNQHDGLLHLQSQLISNFERRGDPKLSNVDEGRRKIKELCGRKMLLVLDDVDDIKQVNMLMGSLTWFGSQSRIIITTREQKVLSIIEKGGQSEGLNEFCERYNPTYMDKRDSLQLFSKHAFKRDFPMEGYEYLSEEVVSIAAGLPLVLVVLGSTFFVTEGKDLWEEKVRKLKKIPNEEVLNKLRFSYESLDDAQKQIFLDIACFFIGEDVTTTRYMWAACEFYPVEGIDALINRSLITVGNDNTFIMHDHLRDLGRNIVRLESPKELGKQSRLWSSKDAKKVLETSQGTDSVVAIRLGSEQSEGPLFASTINDLPNLRYLDMNSQKIYGDLNHLEVKWLRYRSTKKVWQNNWHMKNLVVLELSLGWRNYPLDWSKFQMGKKLKVLDVSWCRAIRELPHLSRYASLEILKLSGTSVCKLDGLGQLKLLKYLEASDCHDLVTLPSLSNLTNLVQLHLRDCGKLVRIQGLETLEALRFFNMTGCAAIEGLPNLSKLKKLVEFKAGGCVKLVEIQGLGELECLQHLDIRGNNLLERLANVSNLKGLKFFNLDDCMNILEIVGLEKLESLESFSLKNCRALGRVSGVSNLKRLKEFLAGWCENLNEIEGLEGLESLKELDLSRCRSLRSLPDISNLKRLESFVAVACESLTEIVGLEGLESLTVLDLRECRSLKMLPDVSNLKRLEIFQASGCVNLIEIKGLDKLESLVQLNLSDCSSLERLPDVSNLKKLTTFEANGCMKVTEILGIDKLNSLQQLSLKNCSSLKGAVNLSNLIDLTQFHIPALEVTDFSCLKNVESLQIKFSDSLIEFCALNKYLSLQVHGGSMKRLPKLSSGLLPKLSSGLKNLRVIGCDEIEDLDGLSSLEHIFFQSCKELIEIQGLDRLGSLIGFNIVDCPSLQRLPDLPNTGMLSMINVIYCDKLNEIERLGAVESLEHLLIYGCCNIKEISNLQRLKNLKTLDIHDLKELTSIHGLEKLKSLESLRITKCNSIQTLPDFSSFNESTQVYISCCAKLTDLSRFQELSFLWQPRCLYDLPNRTQNTPYYETLYLHDLEYDSSLDRQTRLK